MWLPSGPAFSGVHAAALGTYGIVSGTLPARWRHAVGAEIELKAVCLQRRRRMEVLSLPGWAPGMRGDPPGMGGDPGVWTSVG